MNTPSLMQKALSEQWHQLPPALQAHYQHQTNTDVGNLSIEYPSHMQPYLSLLHAMGALINRRGKNIATTVEKHTQGHIQHWKRSIFFSNNDIVYFKSFWVHDKNNELIEYVNAFIGLIMAVHVKNNQLHYEGRNFVIKLGKFLIPIPEWLILGHTTITETALNENEFEMDFRLKHPIFGEIYRYSGRFKNVA
jgi:Domain of unknown function (DUF4166)